MFGERRAVDVERRGDLRRVRLTGVLEVPHLVGRLEDFPLSRRQFVAIDEHERASGGIRLRLRESPERDAVERRFEVDDDVAERREVRGDERQHDRAAVRFEVADWTAVTLDKFAGAARFLGGRVGEAINRLLFVVKYLVRVVNRGRRGGGKLDCGGIAGSADRP